MKLMSLAVLALALQADPPVRPAKPLDPQDPRSVVDHAIFNTRTQRSYETAYTARLSTAAGNFDYKGRSVWVSPGVLYLHYTGSGRDEGRIVRAGDKDIWLHHSPSGEWGTAEQFGNGGAGRGVHNPDEVLGMLAKHTETAKQLKPGILAVTFNGDALAAVMKGQIQGAINPKKSGAKIELEVDDALRIRKLSCDASIDVPGNGVSRYTSEVVVVAYNGATELKFTDEKNRLIPLRPEMKDRIHAVLNGGK